MKSFIVKVTLFLGVVVLCISFKTVETFAATDSTGNSGSKDDIQELIDKGIIDASFKPDNNMTRGELAKIVAKMAGTNGNGGPTSPISPFIDIPGWSPPPGFITGPSSGVYSPGTNVSREELATIVVSALGFNATGLGERLPFNDSDTISSWARDYVGYAVANGLISGDQSNNFNPQNPVTGLEVAQTTINTIEHAEDLGIIPAPVSVPDPEPEFEKEESSEAKIKEAPGQTVIEKIVEGPNGDEIVLTDIGIKIEDLLGAIVALDNSKQIYEFWRDGNKWTDFTVSIDPIKDRLVVTAENGVNKHTYSFELDDFEQGNLNQQPDPGLDQEQQAQTEQAPSTEDVVVPE